MRKIISHIWGQIMPAAGEKHKYIVGKGNLKRVGTFPGWISDVNCGKKAGDEEEAGIRGMKAAFL